MVAVMTEAMTIQRAREIIGDDAADMTDAQLTEAIAALDAIADMLLDCHIEAHRKTASIPHEKEAA
jgi:hypothetical protein